MDLSALVIPSFMAPPACAPRASEPRAHAPPQDRFVPPPIFVPAAEQPQAAAAAVPEPSDMDVDAHHRTPAWPAPGCVVEVPEEEEEAGGAAEGPRYVLVLGSRREREAREAEAARRSHRKRRHASHVSVSCSKCKHTSEGPFDAMHRCPRCAARAQRGPFDDGADEGSPALPSGHRERVPHHHHHHSHKEEKEGKGQASAAQALEILNKKCSDEYGRSCYLVEHPLTGVESWVPAHKVSLKSILQYECLPDKDGGAPRCLNEGCGRVLPVTSASKYCSAACGLEVARLRIARLASALPLAPPPPPPPQPSAPVTSHRQCEAEARAAVQRLKGLAGQTERKIRALAGELARLDEALEQAAAQEPEEAETGEKAALRERAEPVLDCISCLDQHPASRLIRHLETCYRHKETKSTSLVTDMPLKQFPEFCGAYDAKHKLYCRRLRYACTVHHKAPAQRTAGICGCPLLGDDGTLSRVCKYPAKCPKHGQWDAVWRATLSQSRALEERRLADQRAELRTAQEALDHIRQLERAEEERQAADVLSSLSLFDSLGPAPMPPLSLGPPAAAAPAPQ
eukprot:m51a1_g10274 hypothetical protein (570) ;mRNA; f:59247-61623